MPQPRLVLDLPLHVRLVVLHLQAGRKQGWLLMHQTATQVAAQELHRQIAIASRTYPMNECIVAFAPACMLLSADPGRVCTMGPNAILHLPAYARGHMRPEERKDHRFHYLCQKPNRYSRCTPPTPLQHCSIIRRTISPRGSSFTATSMGGTCRRSSAFTTMPNVPCPSKPTYAIATLLVNHVRGSMLSTL